MFKRMDVVAMVLKPVKSHRTIAVVHHFHFAFEFVLFDFEWPESVWQWKH